MHNKTNVLLPTWIFEQAQDKEELTRLIKQYMKRYPNYTIKKVSGKRAICEIHR